MNDLFNVSFSFLCAIYKELNLLHNLFANFDKSIKSDILDEYQIALCSQVGLCPTFLLR